VRQYVGTSWRLRVQVNFRVFRVFRRQSILRALRVLCGEKNSHLESRGYGLNVKLNLEITNSGTSRQSFPVFMCSRSIRFSVPFVSSVVRRIRSLKPAATTIGSHPPVPTAIDPSSNAAGRDRGRPPAGGQLAQLLYD